MPRGASPKREREYNELKTQFHKEHRYPGREEEVAARIVNKQRAEFSETKEEKAKDRKGQSEDRNLPIANYERLTIADLKTKVNALSISDRKKVARFEEKHKNRKGVMQLLQASR